jgi:hypothetical protein
MFNPNWYEELFSPDPLFDMMLGKQVQIDQELVQQNFEEEEG